MSNLPNLIIGYLSDTTQYYDGTFTMNNQNFDKCISDIYQTELVERLGTRKPV